MKWWPWRDVESGDFATCWERGVDGLGLTAKVVEAHTTPKTYGWWVEGQDGTKYFENHGERGMAMARFRACRALTLEASLAVRRLEEVVADEIWQDA